MLARAPAESLVKGRHAEAKVKCRLSAVDDALIALENALEGVLFVGEFGQVSLGIELHR